MNIKALALSVFMAMSVATTDVMQANTLVYSSFGASDGLVKEVIPKAYNYTEDEFNLLSRLVYAEAGCDWMPDWVQQACASVVMNRVEDKRYPNTIWSVIYQRGQYQPTWSGTINNRSSDKVRRNVRKVLDEGGTLPKNVIGQGPRIGRVYTSYYDSILGTTIYFCIC